MDLYLCQNISRREDAYSLLAYAVRRRWGMEHLPAIARSEQGKPHFPDHPDLHFNLSHSGTMALCAVDEYPVGADIEVIRPHHPRLSQRICSAEELAWLEGQEAPLSALCQLWARKEALVNITAPGLPSLCGISASPCPPPGSGTVCCSTPSPPRSFACARADIPPQNALFPSPGRKFCAKT